MNREILFRGKRMDNSEWLFGSYHYKNYPDYKGDMVEGHYIAVSDKCYNRAVDPATVGQYTGLKDKNGKRIYEGDICRNTKTGEIASVKWHGTMAGYVWSNRRRDNKSLFDFGELFRAYDKYEIIGNIYDNPELLKGGGHE